MLTTPDSGVNRSGILELPAVHLQWPVMTAFSLFSSSRLQYILLSELYEFISAHLYLSLSDPLSRNMILFPPVDVVYRAGPLKFSYLWYESSLFSLSSSKTRMSSVLPSFMEDCDDR